MRLRIWPSFLGLVLASSLAHGALPLGGLVLDGPPTPEQLALVLPVTGALAQTATATVRYRPSGSPTWITGHPLYRVQPSLNETPAVGGPIQDVFAWPIIDLTPGTSYEVEITVRDGSTTETIVDTFTTRTLPPAAPAPTKTIAAGSTASQIQAVLDGAVPGDVIQFANGTYVTSSLILRRSGTGTAPIYIRGQSRAGVVISVSNGAVVNWQAASYVVLENMTLRGSGVDSGINASSLGVRGSESWPGRTYGTLRNLTITGVDVGIGFDIEVTGFLAYNNNLGGNNVWNSTFIDTNLTWNDDGLRFPGSGNAIFNNTLYGFGDALSFAMHLDGDGLADVRGVHYYRNDIRMTGDDGAEVDYSRRNVTMYDNRLRNTMTFTSLDPLYGGPFLCARNVGINVGRTLHKWNSTNSGMFVYNNTTVQTVVNPELVQSSIGGWYQPNNGSERSYGFRNNILIYRGNAGNFPWIDSQVHNPIDWTHNSRYPNVNFNWNNKSPEPTTPVFSGVTSRRVADNETVSDPFVVDVVLGANYRSEVTGDFTPALSPGTTPKNSGVAIPNITDGFSGTAPDRGAIIEGRALVVWGDVVQNVAPPAPSSLRVN